MSTVIRFSGDSGDGMQMVGNLFSESAAFAGYGVFTFPDYPAEVRAPQGTVAGVSGFQINFGTQAISHHGDKCDILVAMNPAALVAHSKYATATATIIVDCDNFTKEAVAKIGYDIETLTDILTAAFNEAINKVETTNSEAMAKVTGGLNVPGLM